MRRLKNNDNAEVSDGRGTQLLARHPVHEVDGCLGEGRREQKDKVVDERVKVERDMMTTPQMVDSLRCMLRVIFVCE